MFACVVATLLAAMGASPEAAGGAAVRRGTDASREERSVVVVVGLGDSGATVLSSTVVRRPPRRRPRDVDHPWEVRVEDAKGRVLYSAGVPAAVVRGDVPGPSGRLTSVAVPDPRPAIRVRLPVLPDAVAIRVVERAPRSGARALDRGSPPRPREIARVPYPRTAP